MEIRYAKESDLISIVELCKAHAHYEGSNFEEKNKRDLLYEFIFDSDLNLKCLVVEHHSEIVGYATFFKQFSTWEADQYIYLDCLYLIEKIRGNGIGKQIMEIVKDYAQSNNCSIIQWQTPHFNKKAILFYDQLGAERKPKERFTWKI
ncbi:GNAT family N-acetyltransferase [Chryseobacterium sp.]|uniref:GNAT family N-acetyltransferase n=1 Tax=Chryseobacterium sp. TaxID=1871047 RepID=UPI0025BE12F6|nr:GNAT family N-acetyltransferase [Chryseobacterium sp.]